MTTRTYNANLAANSAFAPAQVDFSGIGKIADSFFNAQEGAMKRQAFQEDQASKAAERERQAKMRDAFSGGLPTGPDGQLDFGEMAKRAAQSGLLDQATHWATNASQAQDRAATRSHQERTFNADQNYRNAQLDMERQKLAQGSTPPAAVQEYKFYRDQEASAGRTPMSFSDFKRQSSAPSYTPFDRALAQADVKRVTEYKDASDAAEELRSNLSDLRSARAAATAAGRNLGPEWSWLPDYYPETQRVTSSSENVRLGFVNKTKGAVSDSEMRIFGNATPGSNMSDAAATPIIDFMDLGAQRTQERAIFFDAWLRSRGSLDGAPEAWKTFVDRNPILIQEKNGSYKLRPDNVSSWRTKIPGLRPSGASDTGQGTGWIDAGDGVRVREKR
jgi:hypothetical protein